METCNGRVREAAGFGSHSGRDFRYIVALGFRGQSVGEEWLWLARRWSASSSSAGSGRSPSPRPPAAPPPPAPQAALTRLAAGPLGAETASDAMPQRPEPAADAAAPDAGMAQARDSITD